MKRPLAVLLAILALTALSIVAGGAAAGGDDGATGVRAEISGAPEFRDATFGFGITKCPQAGQKPTSQPKQLDDTLMDKVEQLSNGGDDQRMNQPDYTCFPHDETSIDATARREAASRGAGRASRST